MSTLAQMSWLRKALLVDAVATAATVALVLLATGLVAGLSGLDATFLRWVALILVPFVLLVGWAALQAQPAAGVARTVIALNIAWVAASLAVLFSGWISPTAFGYVFVIGQAAAAGLFAELQIIGLKKA